MDREMCIGHTKHNWVLVLLFLPGVLCTISGWNVTYQLEQICAVKGSTVMIPCSFSHPEKQIVTRVMWTHNSDAFVGPFTYDSNCNCNSPRFVDLCDKAHNCSFQINQLKFNDSGKYIFRFETTEEKWSGVGGSTLKVIDLISIITQRNGTIIEGDMVNITCKNSCDGLHNPSITWFKNGLYPIKGSTLSFNDISIQDSGNYSCNLNHTKGRLLKVFNINVEYGPRNTSVSINQSSKVDVGSNVTLTCNSRANPSVERYAWFLTYGSVHQTLGSEFQLSLRNVHSGNSGQYYCTVYNKHGSQNSSTVTLKVKNKENSNIEWTIKVIVIIANTSLAIFLLMTIVYFKRRKMMPAPDTGENTEIRGMHTESSVMEPRQPGEVEDSEEDPLQIIYTTVYATKKPTSTNRLQSEEHYIIYSSVFKKQLNLGFSSSQGSSSKEETHNTPPIYSTVFR